MCALLFQAQVVGMPQAPRGIKQATHKRIFTFAPLVSFNNVAHFVLCKFGGDALGPTWNQASNAMLFWNHLVHFTISSNFGGFVLGATGTQAHYLIISCINAFVCFWEHFAVGLELGLSSCCLQPSENFDLFCTLNYFKPNLWGCPGPHVETNMQHTSEPLHFAKFFGGITSHTRF